MVRRTCCSRPSVGRRRIQSCSWRACWTAGSASNGRRTSPPRRSLAAVAKPSDESRGERGLVCRTDTVNSHHHPRLRRRGGQGHRCHRRDRVVHCFIFAIAVPRAASMPPSTGVVALVHLVRDSGVIVQRDSVGEQLHSPGIAGRPRDRLPSPFDSSSRHLDTILPGSAGRQPEPLMGAIVKSGSRGFSAEDGSSPFDASTTHDEGAQPCRTAPLRHAREGPTRLPIPHDAQDFLREPALVGAAQSSIHPGPPARHVDSNLTDPRSIRHRRCSSGRSPSMRSDPSLVAGTGEEEVQQAGRDASRQPGEIHA